MNYCKILVSKLVTMEIVLSCCTFYLVLKSSYFPINEKLKNLLTMNVLIHRVSSISFLVVPNKHTYSKTKSVIIPSYNYFKYCVRNTDRKRSLFVSYTELFLLFVESKEKKTIYTLRSSYDLAVTYK